MKREFIEVPVFSKLIDQIGEEGLKRRIENIILKDPESGDLIKGGVGIRKIRVPKKNKGKSGGYRVIYFDLADYSVTYLILIYDKSNIENLTPAQTRSIKELIEGIKNGHKNKKENRRNKR